MTNLRKKAKQTKRQKRIWITTKINSELQLEFKTNPVTILNALKFASYSDQAKNIRLQAMIKMDEAIKENQLMMDDFHI